MLIAIDGVSVKMMADITASGNAADIIHTLNNAEFVIGKKHNKVGLTNEKKATRNKSSLNGPL